MNTSRSPHRNDKRIHKTYDYFVSGSKTSEQYLERLSNVMKDNERNIRLNIT
jgi:hypothetical protein